MVQIQADIGTLWMSLQAEARQAEAANPILSPLLKKFIPGQEGFAASLANLLAHKLATAEITAAELEKMAQDTYRKHPLLPEQALADLNAHTQNDPAVHDILTPYLFFKGFHALQGYRIAHALWLEGRRHTALFLQSRISEAFAVDIHPAAVIGQGVMMDHATGIVIGETAVVEDNVLFWHAVTLGGKGKIEGQRHPIVRSGGRIGAHSTIIGHIEIGRNAVIAAGSTVVKNVAEGVTIAGNAASHVIRDKL